MTRATLGPHATQGRARAVEGMPGEWPSFGSLRGPESLLAIQSDLLRGLDPRIGKQKRRPEERPFC